MIHIGLCSHRWASRESPRVCIILEFGACEFRCFRGCAHVCYEACGFIIQGVQTVLRLACTVSSNIVFVSRTRPERPTPSDRRRGVLAASFYPERGLFRVWHVPDSDARLPQIVVTRCNLSGSLYNLLQTVHIFVQTTATNLPNSRADNPILMCTDWVSRAAT